MYFIKLLILSSCPVSETEEVFPFLQPIVNLGMKGGRRGGTFAVFFFLNTCHHTISLLQPHRQSQPRDIFIADCVWIGGYLFLPLRLLLLCGKNVYLLVLTTTWISFKFDLILNLEFSSFGVTWEYRARTQIGPLGLKFNHCCGR